MMASFLYETGDCENLSRKFSILTNSVVFLANYGQKCQLNNQPFRKYETLKDLENF